MTWVLAFIACWWLAGTTGTVAWCRRNRVTRNRMTDLLVVPCVGLLTGPLAWKVILDERRERKEKLK